ncbi:uncharacterized protein LOC111519408 [Drosophila willistoni]|uniref:uncharacterized protein LOC111519408 n=1 Tax=Drosophila willistoni TaxID=7260 RepID=UPI000C26D1B5|nr:uncharacterized protein LOC111519408 [Drosophila willistoni]
MSNRFKGDPSNASQWTYMQERNFLLRCAELMKMSSQRLLKQAKTKSHIGGLNGQPNRSAVGKTLSCEKQNEPTLNQNLNSQSILTPKKFLPKQIFSTIRHVSEGQVNHMSQLAKPKNVFTHSKNSEMQNVVIALSSRLEKLSQCKSQSKENPLRTKFQPSVQFLNSVNTKTNSSTVADPFKVSLSALSFKASERIKYLAKPKITNFQHESQNVRRPQASKATLRRIEELAKPKIYINNMDSRLPKDPSKQFKASPRLRRLALPKYYNYKIETQQGLNDRF